MNWTGGQLSQRLHSNKYYLQQRIKRLKLMRLKMAIDHSQIANCLHDQKDKNKNKKTFNNKSTEGVVATSTEKLLAKKKPKMLHHSNKKKVLVSRQGFDLNINVQNYKAIRKLAMSSYQ